MKMVRQLAADVRGRRKLYKQDAVRLNAGLHVHSKWDDHKKLANMIEMKQAKKCGVPWENGTVVVANDPDLGSRYLAKIIDGRASLLPGWAKVQVLRVLRYPRQTAVSDASIATENAPLRFGEERCLLVVAPAKIDGQLSTDEYEVSCRQALEKALAEAGISADAGIHILERHKQGDIKRIHVKVSKRRRKRK